MQKWLKLLLWFLLAAKLSTWSNAQVIVADEYTSVPAVEESKLVIYGHPAGYVNSLSILYPYLPVHRITINKGSLGSRTDVASAAYELGNHLVMRTDRTDVYLATATAEDINGRSWSYSYEVAEEGAAIDALGRITFTEIFADDRYTVSALVNGDPVKSATITGIREKSSSGYALLSEASGTLGEHFRQSFYDLADACDESSSEYLFSYPSYGSSSEIYGDTPPAYYTRDTDCAFAGIDLSGVSTWQSQYDGRSRIVTVVAPSWGVMCNHATESVFYSIANGEQVEFLGADNVPVRRTIESYYIPAFGADITLFKFTEPLPSTVKKYPIFNPRDHRHLFNWAGVPVLNVGQFRRVRTLLCTGGEFPSNPDWTDCYVKIIGNYVGDYGSWYSLFQTYFDLDADRLRALPGIPGGEQFAISGDSGSPVLALDGVQPVLLGVLTGSGLGIAWGTQIDFQILDWITNTVAASGESVSLTDYSGYPVLLPYRLTEWMDGDNQVDCSAKKITQRGDWYYNHNGRGLYYDPAFSVGETYASAVKVETGYSASLAYDEVEGSGRRWAYQTITNQVFNGPEIMRYALPAPAAASIGSTGYIYAVLNVEGISQSHTFTMRSGDGSLETTSTTYRSGNRYVVFFTGIFTITEDFGDLVFYGDAGNTEEVDSLRLERLLVYPLRAADTESICYD